MPGWVQKNSRYDTKIYKKKTTSNETSGLVNKIAASARLPPTDMWGRLNRPRKAQAV